MDGGVNEAEFDYRTGVLDETRVGGAPTGGERGPPSGHVLDRRGDEIGKRSGFGEKGDRVGRLEGERRALALVRRSDPTLDFGRERIRPPEIVETDVEPESRFAGNDVEGRIADIDRHHFEVRGLEIGVSFI